MTDFTYIAINKDGKEVKGTVQANDEVNARARLKKEGMRPISVKKANIFTKDISIGGGGVRVRALSVFCRQFHSLFQAGVGIVSALDIYLTSDGYRVFKAYTGTEALEYIRTENIHLVLMDIMMPEMDGIQTMVKIRELSNVPVILLTAKSEDTDKVLGLMVGADDYITKPFNPVEMQARVKSQLRRYMQLGSGNDTGSKLVTGGIELDDKSKEVTLDGEKVNLTRTEYDILKLLMEHPGQVYSPNEIYEKVWKDNPYGTENTVAVHIRHLREKVEYNPAEPRYLKVVWGRGYKMEGENHD